MRMHSRMRSHDQFASLRGFLVLWIVVGHVLLAERFGGIYDAGFATHKDFGDFGALIALRFIAVDLFFMLSGLVLTLHYHDTFSMRSRGKDIDGFYWRRLKRIYPMHLAMIAVIGLFALTGVPHPITSGNEAVIFRHWQATGIVNLLLMNGWGIMPIASWNEPSWSLSITFLIYVLFPNMLLLLKRLPASAIAYSAVLGLLIIAYAMQRELMPFGSQSDGAGAIIRGVVFALMGVTTGLYAVSQPLDFFRRHGARINLVFLALIVLWTYCVQFDLTLLHFAYAPMLLALYAGGYRWVPPPLANWLGARSFALFMTHYPTLLLLRHLGGRVLADWASPGPGRILAYAVTFGMVLLAAEIAYRLLDAPFAGKRQLRAR